MKRIVWLGALLLLGPLVHARPADEGEAVRAVFGAYRAALLAQEGAKAWELLDADSRAYYGRAITQALELPRAGLDRLDLVTRFIVLRLRWLKTRSELRRMDCRSLFVLAVDSGWVG